MNLARTTRDLLITQSSGFDAPENLRKDLPSSFPQPLKPIGRGRATDTCVFKSSLYDSDSGRGLGISPPSNEAAERRRTSPPLVKGDTASMWHSWTETQWREPRAVLSPLGQTRRWKRWRGKSGWGFSAGRGELWLPRCKSRSSRFLLLASAAFLRAALLPKYPSQRRTFYRNFPIACSGGFLSSSLSRIPSGPRDTGVEEIIANPWHTSWKSMIRKRWSCTFRHGRGRTFHCVRCAMPPPSNQSDTFDHLFLFNDLVAHACYFITYIVKGSIKRPMPWTSFYKSSYVNLAVDDDQVDWGFDPWS